MPRIANPPAIRGILMSGAIVSVFDVADRNDLRHHWSGAYRIDGSNGVWVAVRRDTGEAIHAGTAAELLGKIRDDYAARPVGR
jgi:hypothetical protein